MIPFLTRHLPGHPLLVMQDMPGAGGMVAANYLYNIAHQDGSEIGMVGRGIGIEPLLDPRDKGRVMSRPNSTGSGRRSRRLAWC